MSEESNVVDFGGITRLSLNHDRVLQKAVGRLKEVVIVGFTEDGEEYFASSEADGGTVLWHLARAQKKLLDMPERES